MSITRPRKARILEKAGLRYLAAWLPAETVEALHPEIKKADAIAKGALKGVLK